MAERTRAAARSAYLQALQLIASTVTDAVIRVGAESSSTDIFFAAIGPRPAVRVASRGGSHLRLRLDERLRLVQSSTGGREWSVARVGYRYQLHTDDVTEILAFHLHSPSPGVAGPHLHISAGAGSLRPEFHRAHIPTGAVRLQEFLLFAIRDFAVRPIRADYADVLAVEQGP